LVTGEMTVSRTFRAICFCCREDSRFDFVERHFLEFAYTAPFHHGAFFLSF